MTTREENRIRIVREIPLWGVITGLTALSRLRLSKPALDRLLRVPRRRLDQSMTGPMTLYLLTQPTAEPV